MRGDEIRGGFQPDHTEDRRDHCRNLGMEKRDGSYVTEQAAVILRMVLLIGRFKRGRLCNEDKAE
jgi:hypothetical protein